MSPSANNNNFAGKIIWLVVGAAIVVLVQAVPGLFETSTRTSVEVPNLERRLVAVEAKLNDFEPKALQKAVDSLSSKVDTLATKDDVNRIEERFREALRLHSESPLHPGGMTTLSRLLEVNEATRKEIDQLEQRMELLLRSRGGG